MPFQQFSFPQVGVDLGLALAEARLFGGIAPLDVRPEFLAQVLEGNDLAGAIHTEKARSEFVIAPVLLELRRLRPGHFGLFSGVDLDADSSRGLNGVCDFLITRSPRQHFVSAPLIAIVEAKNDSIRYGLGQCVASMAAAQIFNRAEGVDIPEVYGVVTTGTSWKFLRLVGTEVTVDVTEYHVERVGYILGILLHIVDTAGGGPQSVKPAAKL